MLRWAYACNATLGLYLPVNDIQSPFNITELSIYILLIMLGRALSYTKKVQPPGTLPPELSTRFLVPLLFQVISILPLTVWRSQALGYEVRRILPGKYSNQNWTLNSGSSIPSYTFLVSDCTTRITRYFEVTRCNVLSKIPMSAAISLLNFLSPISAHTYGLNLWEAFLPQ